MATNALDSEDGITPHLYTTNSIDGVSHILYATNGLSPAPIYMDGAGGNDGEDGIDNADSSVKAAQQP